MLANVTESLRPASGVIYGKHRLSILMIMAKCMARLRATDIGFSLVINTAHEGGTCMLRVLEARVVRSALPKEVERKAWNFTRTPRNALIKLTGNPYGST